MRVESILAGISSQGELGAPKPITIMEACDASSEPKPVHPDSSMLKTDASAEILVIGTLGASYASQNATARDPVSLALAPENFCLKTSATGKTAWFEEKGKDPLEKWIMPMQLSGMTIEGMVLPFPTETDGEGTMGALFANNYEHSSVVGFTLERPDPVYTARSGFAGLMLDPTILSVPHKWSEIDAEPQDD